MPDALAEYYARRATEYDRIYDKPERQDDLARMRERLSSLLAGRDVLEVACGTGYWTAAIAARARSVLGTDVNEEVLAIARTRPGMGGAVDFRRMDLYAVPDLGRGFDGALAAFWWSHVPRAGLRSFLHAFHGPLLPGARVVIVDNRYVEGSSTPVARRDANGDTWQRRRLDDGSAHDVLKNFPDEGELRRAIEPLAASLDVEWLDHFWMASYVLGPAGAPA